MIYCIAKCAHKYKIKVESNGENRNFSFLWLLFGVQARFLLLSWALRFFFRFCGYRFVLINKFSAQTGGLGIILKLL